MAALLGALVVVIIHNTAGIPPETLVRAQTQIEHLFKDGGVSVRWADQRQPNVFTIQVLIRRQPGGGPGGSSPAALGTTLGGDHSRSGSSFVFYDRVLSFAHAHARAVETILAYAITHELGHVLLPAPAHTESGLMKAEWCEDDLRQFNADLHFNTIQIAAMQSRLSSCCPDD